jgi:TRAP-type C4-dicarboxylate transport system permease large subunit
VIVTLFIVYIFTVAVLRPDIVGETRQPVPGDTEIISKVAGIEARSALTVLISFVMIFGLVAFVLGGIWAGLFTPTEGAGAGAVVALLFAISRGMRGRELLDAILAVGRTSAPILLLLLSAALYSRVLAMTGLTSAVQDIFRESGMTPFMVLIVMILIWFVLGMVIDSISIMLLTVPIFAPLAISLGYDPIGFAIVGILAIEAGLLTPPFGLLVFTVKVAIRDDGASIASIFRGAAPYWIIILIAVFVISEFPIVATLLPSLLF